jgi:hypothetical protein
LFLGWFVATNHCALGLMKVGAKSEEHAHCPGHPHSDSKGNGGDSNQDSPLACCKTIQAMPLPSNKIMDYAAQFVAFELFADADFRGLDTFAPAQVGEALDTGPPFAVSFAESVLQHSLLSHAPPLV